MTTTLHLEPFGGLAGDMFLAGLLDLGDPRFQLADLRSLTEALVPGEAQLSVERTQRGSLMGTLLSVRTPESARPPHRHLADCLALIEGAPLSVSAKARASAIFRRIAAAEARVHGKPIEAVHFHEVGAVDALIDICGAALALDQLGIQRVVGSPPLVGSGTVRCAHGEMPVPAPGTAEIMRGLEVIEGGGGERLTPTGAAVFAELVESAAFDGSFVVDAIGYGAGHRDPQEGPPNLVRVRLGQVVSGAARSAPSTVWLMEFNLDDLAGEAVGYLVQQLRAAGALEVWTQAVQMKKDRPGVIVASLCRAGQRELLERVAFEHSTTLGVRWAERQRTECERETSSVSALGRSFRVQRRTRPGQAGSADLLPSDLKVEHDDLAAAALELGRPLADLEQVVLAAARAQLGA